MSVKRMWTLGAALAVVLVFGLAAAVGVQPRIAAAQAADASRAQIDQQNQVLQGTIARLSSAAAKQAELETTAQRLSEAVPSTFGVNTFSRQLRETAAPLGVKVESLTPSDAVPYVLPTAQAGAAGQDASAKFFGKTAALVTPENLSVIPVTVSVSGTTDAVLAFATAAQRMDCVFAVTQGSTAESADGSTLLTLTGSIFALKR